MKNKKDFKNTICNILNSAAKSGAKHYKDIKSGDLHRKIRGYPGLKHRMPVCCDAMYDSMMDGDVVIKKPNKGKGASLIIRYKIDCLKGFFIEVGEWKLIKNKINYQLNNSKLASKRVIYTFVTYGKVVYVGICAAITTTLEDRMKRYKNNNESTNKRVRGEILKILKKGGTVKIYAMLPDLKIEYKGLNVDLIKGLEEALINKYNTRKRWNK